MQQNVTSANALLQAFNRATPLYLSTEHDAQRVDAPMHRPLIDAGNPPVNRRGLFAPLGRAIRNQISAA